MHLKRRNQGFDITKEENEARGSSCFPQFALQSTIEQHLPPHYSSWSFFHTFFRKIIFRKFQFSWCAHLLLYYQDSQSLETEKQNEKENALQHFSNSLSLISKTQRTITRALRTWWTHSLSFPQNRKIATSMSCSKSSNLSWHVNSCSTASWHPAASTQLVRSRMSLKQGQDCCRRTAWSWQGCSTPGQQISTL